MAFGFLSTDYGIPVRGTQTGMAGRWRAAISWYLCYFRTRWGGRLDKLLEGSVVFWLLILYYDRLSNAV